VPPPVVESEPAPVDEPPPVDPVPPVEPKEVPVEALVSRVVPASVAPVPAPPVDVVFLLLTF
jgi:hypothetical protein